MNARNRFLLAVVVLGLLMTGPFLLTAAILIADMKPDELAELRNVLVPRLPLGTMITVLGFMLGVAVLRNLFRQYVIGLLSMAEKLRVMHSANRQFRVQPVGPPEVRDLANAINELAAQRDDLLTDVDAKIAQARASVEAEKNRLAALVADLPQPVIVCNLDGRILLYNNRARLQARAMVPDDAAASASLIGLGRSIHAVFDPSLIGHGLETLQHRLEKEDSQPLAHFVTATRAGQLIRVQMTPVLAATEGQKRAIGGYVLSLENISRFVEADTACDHSIQRLANETRSALAGIRTALAVQGPSLATHEITREVDLLTLRVAEATSEYAESVKARWPLEEMLAADLIAAIERRIVIKTASAVRIDGVPDDLWVKVDSYSLVQAVTYLAIRLAEDYGVRLIRLRIENVGAMAALDLLWTGTAISTEILFGWQMETMEVGSEISPLTLRDVIDRHGGSLTSGRETASQQSRFRLQIPLAASAGIHLDVPLARIESRPEYYDFDLFNRVGESHELDDRPLRELTFTAFDTETTGLEPSNGDEIIQIGAVRIVNGRVLRHECIDQLVDPQRAIRPEGIPIHGITDDMVAGSPTIATVLPQFHRFCEDTVLIAHNAAFDMRFLQLKEEATGIRFTQPLLDTLLLSAMIHPNQESHQLEAIAERLGIPVVGRHNALGDALVTGEVFLRMLPLLEMMGLHTLRQVRAAAEQTYYARIRY